MTCPSCDCNEVTTTWTDHKFQYGEDVMLTCHVPVRTCSVCHEKWLDYQGEDILAEAVRVHLMPKVDDAWIIEATSAAIRAEAYSVHQVVSIMKGSKVPIEEMDEWCAQGREDYPCLFTSNVVEGLG